MTYEEFKEKYPRGSDGHQKFTVYGYQWEMLGALAYEGHLSIQFIINSSGTSWYNKAAKVIDGIRKETNNPYRYENWSWLVKSIQEYWKGHTAGKARYE